MLKRLMSFTSRPLEPQPQHFISKTSSPIWFRRRLPSKGVLFTVKAVYFLVINWYSPLWMIRWTNVSQIRYDVNTLKIKIARVILFLERWGFEVGVRFVMDRCWAVSATVLTGFQPPSTIVPDPLHLFLITSNKALQCFSYQPKQTKKNQSILWRLGCLHNETSPTELWSALLKYPGSISIWRRNSFWSFSVFHRQFRLWFVLFFRRFEENDLVQSDLGSPSRISGKWYSV